MRRVTAYLLALLLSFSTSVTHSGSLTLIGAGKAAAAGGGGGSVTFDVAIDASAEDSSTLNSADFTIASTSDRFVLAAMGSRAFASPATHTSMSVEGTGMTQQGSTELVGDMRISRWRLIAPASGSTRTLTGVLSDVDSTQLIAAVVYNGVHQTTPINSTATPTTGSFTDATSLSTSQLTITVTTVTNGKAVAVISVMGFIDAPTLDCSSSSATIRTQERVTLEFVAIVEKDNTGGSTTISCSSTFGQASGDYRLDGYGIQPP